MEQFHCRNLNKAQSYLVVDQNCPGFDFCRLRCCAGAVCSVSPSVPTDPCSPPAVLQCPEAQKLLNITRELLHTEEAYVKRLNLLDQVTWGPQRAPLRCSWRWTCDSLIACAPHFNFLYVPAVLAIEIWAELD